MVRLVRFSEKWHKERDLGGKHDYENLSTQSVPFLVKIDFMEPLRTILFLLGHKQGVTRM